MSRMPNSSSIVPPSTKLVNGVRTTSYTALKIVRHEMPCTYLDGGSGVYCAIFTGGCVCVCVE